MSADKLHIALHTTKYDWKNLFIENLGIQICKLNY